MGSIFGDVLGFLGAGRAGKSISDANINAENAISKNAAANTTAVQGAQGAADTTLQNYLGAANRDLGQTMSTATTPLAPYMGAGSQGITSLANYAASNPTFKFNMQDYFNDPAYKFQMQQGTEALNNSASTRGLTSSGNAAKDLTSFGQGLASTYYNDAFNRALQTFGVNQNTTLANLSTLAGFGQNANSTYSADVMNTGAQQNRNTIGTGTELAGSDIDVAKFLANYNANANKQAADYGVAAAGGHAAGILGQDKALGSLVGDTAGLIMNPALGIFK